jgi:hypothetical protein
MTREREPRLIIVIASPRPIVPGNKFHSATAFPGLSFLGGISEKILERLEQERTEATAIRVGVLEPVMFQYLRKEILREVLRILH